MTATQRRAVNSPQQSPGDVTSAAAEQFGFSLTSPVALFKANVSHCYQEVTISRTGDLYCHRVCILRDYMAHGGEVHVAARMTIIKGLRTHAKHTPEHEWTSLSAREPYMDISRLVCVVNAQLAPHTKTTAELQKDFRRKESRSIKSCCGCCQLMD